jgi:hypothetical protein
VLPSGGADEGRDFLHGLTSLNRLQNLKPTERFGTMNLILYRPGMAEA